jgi:tetratricopeptide (TPR) repeat protein
VFRSAAPQPLDPEVRVVVAMVEEAAARGRDADAHAVRAAALAVGRRHGEALAAIDEAIAQHPSHAAWHSDRAALLIALADQGDPSRLPAAVDAADRALSLSPGLPEALFNRALALDALADTATTADALVRARGDADAAWTRYLEADAASPWADEARARLTALRDGPPLR